MAKKENEIITWETFTEGLWRENPVFVMLLGMCPVLAVTNSAINALAMGLATTFVLVASGTLISLLRRQIPKQVRIATYIVIIATFVTIVDYTIQAISLDLYNALGAFIQLIVVNCIILGRAEAYASRNRPLKSVTNALGCGQQKGYRIYPGRNRAQFASLGLMPGDLVTAVNGAPLDDPNSGLATLRGIGAGGSVTLTIERNGSEQQLTLDMAAAMAALPSADDSQPQADPDE